jgi:diguanylate cyclase (GGDEF)-like protein/PAS domain S-box-containing protein
MEARAVMRTGTGWIAVTFGVAMAMLVAVNAVLPVGTPGFSITYVVVELGTAGAIVLGVRLNRPRQRPPWLLTATAFGVSGGVSTAWFTLAARGADPTVLSPLYLIAYAAGLAGLWCLIRHRSPRAGLPALLDTAIVTTGVAVLVWVFVVHPTLASSGPDAALRRIVVVYALISLVLMAMVARLWFGGGRHAVALRWLAVSAALHLTAQIISALPGGSESVPTTLRLLAAAAFGVAGLHPTMCQVTEPRAGRDHPIHRWRLVALWAASVAAPLTLLIGSGTAGGGRTAVIAVGSVALFTLVVARMWGLLRTVREVLDRQHEDRFRALVEHANEAVMIVHPERGLTYVSPSVERVWGFTIEQLREQGVELIAPEDRERLTGAVLHVADGPPGTVCRFEGRGLHADGGWRHVALTLASHLDDPAIDGIVVTCRDVTSQRELELQLTHQAFHDPLTGLPNRALFTDRVTQALESREVDSFSAVLFLDLDDFKTVNDGLGHGSGDDLLRIVATRLSRVVRPEDTVARFGGDEFAVLLPRVRSLDTVTMLAERLLAALTEPITIAQRRVEPQASIGIATSHHGPSAEVLLRDADAAMYAAKYDGKARFQVFDPAMHADAVRRLQLKMDLQAAADRGELAVAYQTIHAISSGEVIGMEALLRWTHPVRGPIPPDEFIPLAEETGSIDALGAFVLDRACDDVARYRALTGTDVYLSVNVSPAQLTSPDLVATIAAALERTGFPAARLVLELTESVFIADDAGVTATLEAIQQLGIRLAIDDFGTGYCSLAYLERFHFDVVKVDKSFIDVLGDPAGDPRLTVGILDLIDSLGVPAVAEGIETAPQLDALRAIGCAFGQGYLWSRPAPIQDLPIPADLHTASS